MSETVLKTLSWESKRAGEVRWGIINPPSCGCLNIQHSISPWASPVLSRQEASASAHSLEESVLVLNMSLSALSLPTVMLAVQRLPVGFDYTDLKMQ